MQSEISRLTRGRRRIYLLRHGDVSYFDERGEPLRQDDVALNPDGRAQAAALAAALEDVRLDRIISSGLPRTVETARFLAEGRDLAVENLGALREIAPGPLEKLPHEGFEEAFTQALRGPIHRDTSFLGGETFGAHEDRVLPCFLSIVEAADWQTIAIVAHGGTNRRLLVHALGSDMNAFARLEQDAGCVNIIDIHPDGSSIVRLINFSPVSPVKNGQFLTSMEKIYLEHRVPQLKRDANGSS